ncbi:hypothetical protein LZZ85_11425 [Terrimonas sp. NA20]|uniref:Late control protein n=1 Tax=Terrimonas ginsenosidimutans TaxID=2908004 RepID=A0ABS9KRE7_9BACT|nr:contractile injection system protein, VgrG/Pvc8 family [Terrimonas ginsenosidimutans]MCG2614899.1 hypothetical protein [Terrimonas ginsenosidimutans]
MNAPKTSYEIIYNGKNITADIFPHVASFSYSDRSQGEADELEIVLEDSEKLWQNAWYPVKGDTVVARIIDKSGTLECGTFTVDEISGDGSVDGDTFTIKALAAGINNKIRTKHSQAHEGKSLREIANTIALKHGLKVEGEIRDVRIARITQYRETDLKFLKRISFEYGYSFSIRGDKLIFTNIFDLENKASALIIHRSEIVSYSITDKTSETYKNVKLVYHNPKQKKTIEHEQAEAAEAFKNAKNDTLEVRTRAENKQQAELISKVALYRANSRQQEGRINMPGFIYAVAGNNCEVQGLGMFSGQYYLDATTHSVDRDGGYNVELEIKRIGLVNKEKQKNKKKV